MTAVVLLEDLPRLRLLLKELGVQIATQEDASKDAMYVSTTPSTPHAHVTLVSTFPFHQARQLIRTANILPEPEPAPHARAKKLRRLMLRWNFAPIMAGAGELHDPQSPPLALLEPALDVHQAMEIAWVQHRLALMQTELPTALANLQTFRKIMSAHLTLENEQVLPEYHKTPPSDGYERGGAPEIFATEHTRIENRLQGFERHVQALIRQNLPDEARQLACLHLLDRQKVFTDLLEHHDHRERAFLYPHLAKILPEPAQEALVERFLELACPPDGRHGQA